MIKKISLLYLLCLLCLLFIRLESKAQSVEGGPAIIDIGVQKVVYDKDNQEIGTRPVQTIGYNDILVITANLSGISDGDLVYIRIYEESAGYIIEEPVPVANGHAELRCMPTVSSERLAELQQDDKVTYQITAALANNDKIQEKIILLVHFYYSVTVDIGNSVEDSIYKLESTDRAYKQLKSLLTDGIHGRGAYGDYRKITFTDLKPGLAYSLWRFSGKNGANSTDQLFEAVPFANLVQY